MRSRLTTRLAGLLSKPLSLPAFLLFLCLVAYALFIRQMGFYWDDFPIAWIYKTMGPEGLARYFSTNRPIWGLLYTFTSPLIGSTPLPWQIAALLLRWGTGVLFWWLLRLAWPRQAALAAWAAALFVVYPGFSEQWIAYVFAHFFIILNLFLLSLCLNLLAVRLGPERRGWFWPLMALSWAASAVNLLSMEYFFLLDLLRPVLVWLALGDEIQDPRRRASRALLLWLPFLGLMVGVMAWRAFFFGYGLYQPTLVSRLKANPAAGIVELAQTAARDLWTVTAGAWARAFAPPPLPGAAQGQGSRYWLVTALTALGSLAYLLTGREKADPAGRSWRAERLAPLGAGLLALLVAGGPFWLTGLPIGLDFPNDRFTIPFMLGASLALAALIRAVPVPRWGQVAALALALGFAAGLHFRSQVAYRLDWSAQDDLFTQMLWRMPDLQPGTALVANELPLRHYTDNSLSAPLNWIYDPVSRPETMNYILYYPSVRAKSEPWLTTQEKGLPIRRDYLATTFTGSTSQIVMVYFNPPGCLRVLDPELDAANWMTPESLRRLLALSTTDPILAEPAAGKPAPRLPEGIYPASEERNWCYYFEKADLARQLKNWQQVADLGDEAFALDDYPNDPAERLPFIEGYAHAGQWQRALEITRQTGEVSPVMQPVICMLWGRINQETPDSTEKTETLRAIQTENGCAP